MKATDGARLMNRRSHGRPTNRTRTPTSPPNRTIRGGVSGIDLPQIRTWLRDLRTIRDQYIAILNLNGKEKLLLADVWERLGIDEKAFRKRCAQFAEEKLTPQWVQSGSRDLMIPYMAHFITLFHNSLLDFIKASKHKPDTNLFEHLTIKPPTNFNALNYFENLASKQREFGYDASILAEIHAQIAKLKAKIDN